MVGAALADVPGHALWGMTQLERLTIECADGAVEDVEGETPEQWEVRMDAAESRVRELLPSLTQINYE